MKKILSYFLPITLRQYHTDNNGILAVTLFKGKKLLDSAVSNYSYGTLQRILCKALLKLPFDQHAQDILVLGMGAGSIVQTIRNKFQSDAHITLVEIDAAIIRIAEEEFQLSAFKNVTIVHDDAFAFIQNNANKFDLVIIDLFIIDTIPGIFTKKDFLYAMAQKIRPGGKLVYNTIRDTLDRTIFAVIVTELVNSGLETKILKKLDGSNDVILGKKKMLF
jgi:predicted membrane-bound spermidine synthase